MTDFERQMGELELMFWQLSDPDETADLRLIQADLYEEHGKDSKATQMRKSADLWRKHAERKKSSPSP